MDRRDDRLAIDERDKAKLAYEPPKLVRYGTIIDLTRAAPTAPGKFDIASLIG